MQVDRTFLNVCAENLVKVARTREVISRKKQKVEKINSLPFLEKMLLEEHLRGGGVFKKFRIPKS